MHLDSNDLLAISRCSLPKVVKRRLKALKKLQFQMIEIESKFYEEVHELECKYANKYAPLFDRVSPLQNCQDSSLNSWLILCSVDTGLEFTGFPDVRDTQKW